MDATESAWRRGFVRLPWYACLLFLCPFVAWTPLVKFTVRSMLYDSKANLNQTNAKPLIQIMIYLQPGLGDDGGNLNALQKIFVFYKAPIVKYVGTCISYLIFLLLYSYVVLFGFRYEFQIPELIVYGERYILCFSNGYTANYYKLFPNETILFEIFSLI